MKKPSPIKLGIVCPYDYFRFGGVQEHIKAVASEFRKRGYEVKILTPTPPHNENDDPDHVITLGRSTLVNASSTSFEVSVSATPSDIDEVLEQEQFDIIHYHEPEIPLLSSQILSRSTAINVATLHANKSNTLVNKPVTMLAGQIRKNNAKHFDAVTAVSTAAAYHLSQQTDEQIHIIPNGINLAEYDASQCDYFQDFHDDVPTILYIGRLEKRKGVEYLLKAYRELLNRRSYARLVICGDGPRRQSLEEYIDKWNLQNVHLLGFVTQEDKLRLLKTATVFCSPAVYGESFGIVLVEAMAMGIPIVGGINPGYVSVLQGTGAIGLVNPKQSYDMSLRLELMLFDEPTRRLYKKWELAAVKQYDYKVIVDQYQALFESLLQWPTVSK